MKTTIEVFIIMRAGKIDKRDHEIAKKTLFFQFVNNTSYGFPTHVTSLVLEMLLKLTKKTLISLKSMKTIPVKKLLSPGMYKQSLT